MGVSIIRGIIIVGGETERFPAHVPASTGLLPGGNGLVTPCRELQVNVTVAGVWKRTQPFPRNKCIFVPEPS